MVRAGGVAEERGTSWLLVAIAAGVGLGIFSVLADGIVRARLVVTLGNIIAPWAIVAFAVGRSVGSVTRGAYAGGSALLVGVLTYYVGQAMRVAASAAHALSASDLFSSILLLWLVAAVTVGPLMGMAGAESGRVRPRIAAVIALPALLVAEAGFLIVDRRPWLWDLSREPYRLSDLAVIVGLVAVAVALPRMLIDQPRRRRAAYALLAGLGTIGILAIIGLYRLLVGLA